jgi:UDP-N-acetylmuramoyl-tripeptide--D-alanyl-D-alanine ligase
MIRSLSQFALACHGRLHGADREFDEVSIDTRKLVPGNLFAALHGEHVDGHNFIAAAAAAGAAGALVQRRIEAPLSQIQVSNVEQALTSAAKPRSRKCWPRFLASLVRAWRRAAI